MEVFGWEGVSSSRKAEFEGELSLLPPTYGHTCHPHIPLFLSVERIRARSEPFFFLGLGRAG